MLTQCMPVSAEDEDGVTFIVHAFHYTFIYYSHIPLVHIRLEMNHLYFLWYTINLKYHCFDFNCMYWTKVSYKTD